MTAPFPAAVGLQGLQLLLVTPNQLYVGDVNYITGLYTQSSQLARNPALFQEALRYLEPAYLA